MIENKYALYTSRPANSGKPLPAVIVIQEIWGTDTHIPDLTDRFAKAEYLAVAPDLYTTNGKRPDVASTGYCIGGAPSCRRRCILWKSAGHRTGGRPAEGIRIFDTVRSFWQENMTR
ncbi:dienelactone hydrolase family protein [Aneurinibacillus terranovensis]|uniref:dienelactone hydrolase family protein n=1 Tax=Aneurinibacillus terranovensis TaxID=278991 RepID=UPI0003FB5E37|nr:dienelactone hydrolase family protein [Aneurinibacillus terranovensis]